MTIKQILADERVQMLIRAADMARVALANSGTHPSVRRQVRENLELALATLTIEEFTAGAVGAPGDELTAAGPETSPAIPVVPLLLALISPIDTPATSDELLAEAL